MKIAYVASEITPFASTGGLAEVAGALPAALAAQGHTVWRFMPMYRAIMESPHAIRPLDIKLTIPVGFRNWRADVWTCEDPGPRTYFIRRDEFFDRSQLYSLPDRDYDDNFERFVFFQKAVVALLDALQLKPDIVHGNDWQTGLLPFFLQHGIQGRERGRRERCVFTIHNLAYQGVYPGSDFTMTNLPFNAFSVDTVEFYGQVNCLKAGITGSDVVTTVSPTYAREIQTKEDGFGLDGVLRSAGSRLHGILNGIDMSVWDPAQDGRIGANFDPDHMAGKKTCRQKLANRMKLRLKPDTALLGMVTRMVDMKGMDIVAEAMPELMKRNVAVAILGSGQDKYQKLCAEWAEAWPGRFSVRIGYDAQLAHEIQAGSDLCLIPSRHEPCGLTQFYSLRYGTVPVVHAVGGLEDSVQDLSADGATGTGIKFRDYRAESLIAAVDRGLAHFGNPALWSSIQRRGMTQDFSWAKPASEYLALYRQIAPQA
jgi:starch synthase